jgi:hypothetical protein
MTPQHFMKKWKASTLNERAAAQSHFNDLCDLLDEQNPVDADPTGSWFCFERGAKKTGGGEGWADVWRKGCFAWEYKGKRRDLNAAFAQLQRYAIALENPPLLVTSDMETIEIHTNFTNTVEEIHRIPIDELASQENFQKLKWLFSEPDRLKPGQTKTALTEEAAERFADLAEILQGRGGEPQRVAHFLNRILFCFFAQHAGLLPAGVVERVLRSGLKHPEQANDMLRQLFRAMQNGGPFGAEVIDWFNGGLFDSDDIVPLERQDIGQLLSVASMDWSAIEPSIFGTLFERGMDPAKRDQIGAHYTDAKSIMRIVGPVVVEPLAAEWQQVKSRIESALKTADIGRDQAARTRAYNTAQKAFDGFLFRLHEFRVLDPACGSGNFLYLALQGLKDLEHKASLDAEAYGLKLPLAEMHVGVQCVQGIESNTYAAELARVTVWIGEIQWMLRHGMAPSKNPILKSLERVECRDAILQRDGKVASWPKADAVIGNPPFLGDKKMRRALGTSYVSALRSSYDGRVPGGADLVTYWFEKGREQLETRKAERVGFVATNSIRQKSNRTVLSRIEDSGRIFEAWSDEPWVNEGAAVRVSIVCYDGKKVSTPCRLNGLSVPRIHADLTGGLNLTQARRQPENVGRSFFGLCLAGAFVIDGATARSWLALPRNPGGRPNSDVVRPICNGIDLTKRQRDRWVIDFGPSMTEQQAAAYEPPFQHVIRKVKPKRVKNNRKARALRWWLHGETRPGMRKAISGLSRFIATPETAKHRYFAWVPISVAPEHKLVVIAREDDIAMGVLSSRLHRIWALAVGSTLEDRPVYTTSACFDTFPFPDGLTPDLAVARYKNPAGRLIAAASNELMELRSSWLHPKEWVEPRGEPVKGLPDRLIAKEGRERDLKGRTLTALYNENPAWLVNAQAKLDDAVAKAYGWSDYTPEMPDDAIVARLFKLNHSRTPDLLTTQEKHLAIAKSEQRKPSAEVSEVATAATRTLRRVESKRRKSA